MQIKRESTDKKQQLEKDNTIESIFSEILAKLGNISDSEVNAIKGYKNTLIAEQQYLSAKSDKYNHGERAANALLKYVLTPSPTNLEEFKRQANHSGFNPRTRQAAWIALGVVIGVVVGLITLASLVLTSGKAAIALTAADVWLGSLLSAIVAGAINSIIGEASGKKYEPVLAAKASGKALLKESFFIIPNPKEKLTENSSESTPALDLL